VSVEIDEMRARACQELFAALPNVTVLQGDWRQITARGPFDPLVLDGGGGGKKEKDAPAEPAKLLKPGGTVVLDDMYPPLEHWPEADGPRDEFTRSVTVARRYWLQHPDLFATEIRLRPQMGTIVATLKASRP
jgi:predicted O-methyltransferase YrrM